MNLTREYLTCAEMKLIIDDMLNMPTPFERRIVKEALIAQMITDGDFKDMDCIAIYNKVLEDGMTFRDVRGYDVIDEVVAEYNSTATVVRNMCADLSEKLDASLEEIKKLNVEEVKKTLIDTKEV